MPKIDVGRAVAEVQEICVLQILCNVTDGFDPHSWEMQTEAIQVHGLLFWSNLSWKIKCFSEKEFFGAIKRTVKYISEIEWFQFCFWAGQKLFTLSSQMLIFLYL